MYLEEVVERVFKTDVRHTFKYVVHLFCTSEIVILKNYDFGKVNGNKINNNNKLNLISASMR